MTATIEATAWTLIHFCWQGAVIAGIYGLVSVAFRRRASQVRYVLALSALLAMAVAAVVTFGWEMRSPASPAYKAATSAVSNALSSGDFPRMVAPGITSPAEPAASASQPSLPNLMGWIDAFWVVGVLALAVRGVGGWWLIHRLRASAMAQAPEAVSAAFQRISQALGLRKTVLLRVSNAIGSPVTVGALRAIVLLPVSAVTLLGPDELEVVLAHELAHVRRADFLWNLVQTLVETLFFFHPAVWWIEKKVSLEREMACDDAVIAETASPRAYAECLTHLAEKTIVQRSVALAQAALGRIRQTSLRVAQILDVNRSTSGSRLWKPAVSLVAGFAVVCALGISRAPKLIAFRDSGPSAVSSEMIATASPALEGAQASQAEFAQQPVQVVPASLKARAPHRRAHRYVHTSSIRSATAIAGASGVVRTANVRLTNASAAPVAFTETLFVVIEGSKNDASNEPVYQIHLWHVMVLHPVVDPNNSRIPAKKT